MVKILNVWRNKDEPPGRKITEIVKKHAENFGVEKIVAEYKKAFEKTINNQ